MAPYNLKIRYTNYIAIKNNKPGILVNNSCDKYANTLHHSTTLLHQPTHHITVYLTHQSKSTTIGSLKTLIDPIQTQ